MDIALHGSPADIEEDLEYYFSEQRDLHNQVRPADDIRSFTPDAETFSADPGPKTVGNLFYPFAPRSLQRIFIGVSFPLFSNNWGAAFLRHLLELIGPDGCIVVPVYPEVQAHEKGMWCRSSLENIFRSRARYVGASNIWAENDGVMTMRVGRRWPPVIPSTARWLFRHAPRRVLAAGLENNAADLRQRWLAETARFWRLAQRSAVVERIIRDRHGMRGRVRLTILGEDSGILALECLMSHYLRVTHAAAIGAREDAAALQAMDQTCATHPHGALRSLARGGDAGPCDVLYIANEFDEETDSALARLAHGGMVILAPECAGQAGELSLAEPAHYSCRVAQRLQTNVPIYHTSARIEKEIARENERREGVFTVFRKP